MDFMTLDEVGDWLRGKGFSAEVVDSFAGEPRCSLIRVLLQACY